MSRLARSIRDLGGLAATFELHAAGFGRETLRLAVRAGEIRRIRKGWYILVDTPASIADCARVGGRATCVTAVDAAGLWVLDRPAEVHVAVRPNACQLRDPRDYRKRGAAPGARVHWTDEGTPGGRLVVALPEAIRELARCQGTEAAFVAWESALARGELTRAHAARVCAGLPVAVAVALSRARGASESIIEAVFLCRSSAFGARVRQQVRIGRDRVDFLLGDRLVVEVDGREFHERQRDYERDARLTARGYRVLRFGYRQVVFDWPSVRDAVAVAVARGDAA